MPFLKPASPRASPAGAPSVTQTLPSRSMKKPCGKFMTPLPKLFTNLPSMSTWMIGSRVDSAQPLAPQRSRIHRCLPSRIHLDAARDADLAAFELVPVVVHFERVARDLGVERGATRNGQRHDAAHRACCPSNLLHCLTSGPRSGAERQFRTPQPDVDCRRSPLGSSMGLGSRTNEGAILQRPAT